MPRFCLAICDTYRHFPKVIQGNTLSPGVIVFIVFNLVVVFAFVTIHQSWEATLGAGVVVGSAAGLGAVAVVRVGFGTLAGTVVGALAAAAGGAFDENNLL